MTFGDLGNLWRFHGLVERREILFIVVLSTHTTSGWILGWRDKELVEVSWARNYFLVSWEVNRVSS